MDRINWEGDMLLLCTLPGFGNNWLAPLGIFLDIIGVIFISADIFDLLKNAQQSNSMRKSINETSAVLNVILANVESAYNSANERREEHFAPPAGITPPDLILLHLHRDLEGLKQQIVRLELKADTASEHTTTIANAISNILEATIVSGRSRYLASTLGLALVIAGFFLQIASSWPCS